MVLYHVWWSEMQVEPNEAGIKKKKGRAGGRAGGAQLGWAQKTKAPEPEAPASQPSHRQGKNLQESSSKRPKTEEDRKSKGGWDDDELAQTDNSRQR